MNDMYKTRLDNQPAFIWARPSPTDERLDKEMRKVLLIASLTVLVITLVWGIL